MVITKHTKTRRTYLPSGMLFEHRGLVVRMQINMNSETIKMLREMLGAVKPKINRPKVIRAYPRIPGIKEACISPLVKVVIDKKLSRDRGANRARVPSIDFTL